MPSERTKSLRWAFEDLQKFSQDPSLPEAERSKAAELLSNFPTPEMISEWIGSDVECIPIEAAIAIEGAGELLLRIHRSEHASEEMKRQLRFTLRHFPTCGESQRWVKAAPGWTIRTWLREENQYR